MGITLTLVQIVLSRILYSLWIIEIELNRNRHNAKNGHFHSIHLAAFISYLLLITFPILKNIGGWLPVSAFCIQVRPRSLFQLRLSFGLLAFTIQLTYYLTFIEFSPLKKSIRFKRHSLKQRESNGY